MMIAIISITIFLSACFHIQAELKHSVTQIYIFKSATTSLIILLACLLGDFDSSYQVLIIVGLFFSLLGDVFLISPKAFLLGLISFLIAHCFYIAAFVSHKDTEYIFYLPSLLPFIVPAIFIFIFIYSGLGKMKAAVIFYLLVIVLMAWQALNQYLANPNIYYFSAIVGASFFMLSDSLIAIDKFKSPVKYERFLIMSTYYLGQWFIALSILSI